MADTVEEDTTTRLVVIWNIWQTENRFSFIDRLLVTRGVKRWLFSSI